MALQSAKHEAIHTETGDSLAKLKGKFDDGYHLLATDHADDHPEMAAIIYQIQKMQDEINYLRGIIDANNDKVGITTSQANAITANTAKTSFPGLGTTSTTALAGDTTTITTDQASAITANTAKTSMRLGTTSLTALAGDTRIPAFTADDTSQLNTTKSTAITFGNFTTTVVGKTTTYTLPITVTETTVVTGKSPLTTTLTKTGSITLT
tara:strand:+ start:156 stop:782 length:627 start_codon:yes stop_codon:yes gene_type:complete